MDGVCFSSSPNWYCTKVIDCNEEGIIAFGSRNAIVLLRMVTLGSAAEVSGDSEFKDILRFHKDRVTGLAFCNDSSRLASVGDDCIVNIVDIQSKSLVFQHCMHKFKITAVTWACVNDLTYCVVSGDEKGNLISVNATSMKAKQFLFSKEPITALSACSHLLHMVSVGYQGGLIVIVDLMNKGTSLHKLRHHTAEIQSLCWAPFIGLGTLQLDELVNDSGDEFLLVSGSKDRTIRIWSTKNGMPIQKFQLPSSLTQDRRRFADNKTGLWLTVHWPRCRPDILLTSSYYGELIVWNLTQTDKQPWFVVGHKESKGHSRTIFNIVSFQDVACTISLDRQIIFWNIKSTNSHQILTSMPTIGGFINCLAFSPINPGYLAIGCGDNMIRVWNTTSANGKFDVQNFWQGIKSKVTALAWHPQKENLLGFGTDDGRIATQSVLSNKLPSLFTTFHKKIVYTIMWAPRCPVKDNQTTDLHLYSCGDGVILIHNPKEMERPAINLDKLLRGGEQTKSKSLFHTEVSFKPDYSVLMIGNDDGSIVLYNTSTLELQIVITARRKLIQSLRWHPEYTWSSTQRSRCCNWVIVASRDNTIHVHDMAESLNKLQNGDCDFPVKKSSPTYELVGHTLGVASLAWNPHLEGQLLSASFDGTVRVWNVFSMETIACYCGHAGRVYCAEWNPSDPDLVFSGGDDFTLHRWKISKQDRCAKSKKVLTTVKKSDSKSNASEISAGLSVDVMNELDELLEQRRQEILSKCDNTALDAAEHIKSVDGVPNSFDEKLCCASVEMSKPLTLKVTAEKEIKRFDEKKKKPKSMFPLSNSMENSGKAEILKDCMLLASGDGEFSESESRATLGAFVSRIEAYKLLKTEADNHVKNDRKDLALLLDVWKGNISGVLRDAATKEKLSDWLLAVAPSVSHSLWEEMCSIYTKQLVSDNQPHKAVAILLAINKVYEAIDLLKKHVSYKEAIILAKVRLPPNDPLIVELVEEWAHHLERDNHTEQAAKCYLSIGQNRKAASILRQRQDPASLRVAAYILMKSEDAEQAFACASLAVFESLAKNDCLMAERILDEHPIIKPFHLVLATHSLLLASSTNNHLNTDENVLIKTGIESHQNFFERMFNAWQKLGYSDLLVDKLFLDLTMKCLTQDIFPNNPQKMSEVIAFLSVKLVHILVLLLQKMLLDALQVILSAITTLNRTTTQNNVHWFLSSILSLYQDPLMYISTLEDVCGSFHASIFSAQLDALQLYTECIVAYGNYAQLNVLLEAERQQQLVVLEESASSITTEKTEYEKKIVCVDGMIVRLLNSKHAEINQLRLRLDQVKKAIATLNAKWQKGKVMHCGAIDNHSDETWQSVNKLIISDVPADELVNFPGVTIEELESDVQMINHKLLAFEETLLEISFPNPYDSCCLLVEYCQLLFNRHNDSRFHEYSQRIVDFGAKHSALGTQRKHLIQLFNGFQVS